MNCFLKLILTILSSPSMLPLACGKENSEYFHGCSGGQREVVGKLVEENPSIVHSTTEDGENCLHLVAISGDAGIARILLERGADANVRSAWDGGLRMHPLSWSTYYGRHEIVELLIQHGADVNADFDSGQKEKDESPSKTTVLDVVESILIGLDDDEKEKERFIKT